MPRVSVLMASYNHAAYVADAMRSVLGQSFADLELIVVDDGSRDGSNAVIRSVEDPRVTHVALERNAGAGEATRIALARATGELVAICNSDDVWEADKLERQVAALDEMPEVGACFTRVAWIGATGESLTPGEVGFFNTIFDQPNRSRFGWLKWLIERGNCLCHPSVLIRRSVYATLGGYNNHLRQLPDYDMWLRVLQHHEIHVMAERLVRFRMHGANTSRVEPSNQVRSWRETVYIVTDFFRGISQDNFVRAFGVAELDDLRPMSDRAFAREKAMYLSRHEGPLRDVLRPIGLQMAFELSCSDGPQAIPALEFQAINGELAPTPAPAEPPEPAVESGPSTDTAPAVPATPVAETPDPRPVLAEEAVSAIDAPPEPAPDPEPAPLPVGSGWGALCRRVFARARG